MAHALALGALLMADAGTGAGKRVLVSPQPVPGGPFTWLLGRWTGSGDFCCWTERDENAPRRARKPAGPETVDLTFTDEGGKIRGALEGVAPNGPRKIAAELVIEVRDDVPLVWREAGLRYRGHLQLAGKDPASQRKALAWATANRLLRFSDLRGPTARKPYPIGIDLRLADGKLFLRRVQGPQHGAAVEQDYEFERAP